jgi:flavin reductase (DIM6/NTAB) family NADH-FMN oxidoreductase RutF
VYIDLDHPDRSPRDLYRLFISVVTPRPIAWVSTLSVEGARNLAPFSFFNMVSCNPPVLIFCPARLRDGRKKDTLVNVEAAGEFVVNLVTEDVVERMHQTSAPYPPGVDEFEAAGLTPMLSTRVKAPRVAESAASLECALERIIEYGDHPGAGCVVFGKVLAVHINDEALGVDGLCDQRKLRTIGRLGGNGYTRATDVFDLPPPVI